MHRDWDLSLQHLILLTLCNSSQHGQSNHSSTPTRWKIPLELKRNSSKAQLEFLLLNPVLFTELLSYLQTQYSGHLLSATSECHFPAGSALEGVLGPHMGHSHLSCLLTTWLHPSLTLVHHPQQKPHGKAWYGMVITCYHCTGVPCNYMYMQMP